MLMKPLLLITVIFFIASCDNQKNTRILKFDPVPGKTYSMEVKTVTSVQGNYGITGDTLLFAFDLVPRMKDSMGDRVVLLIKKLMNTRSPNKVFGQQPDKSVKQGQMIRKQNGPDLNAMMEKYIIQKAMIINALEGDSILLIIDKSGQLIMEDGFEELVQSVSKETTIDPVEVRRAVKDYIGAAAMRDFLRQLFFYLPAKEIKAKDTWVDNSIFTALAPVKHSNLITVDTIVNDKVFLKITAQLSAGGEGNQYLKGTKSGSVTVDLNSGFPLEMQLNEQSTTTTTGGEVIRRKMMSVKCSADSSVDVAWTS